MDQKNMARTDGVRAFTEGHPIKAEQPLGRANAGWPSRRLAAPGRAAVPPQAGHQNALNAVSAQRSISSHAVDATPMQVPHGNSLFGFAVLGLASNRLAESAPCADAMKGPRQLIKARARAGAGEKFQQQQGTGAFKKHRRAQGQGRVVMKKAPSLSGADRSEGACR